MLRPNSKTDPEFSKFSMKHVIMVFEAIAYSARYEDRLIELVRKLAVQV